MSIPQNLALKCLKCCFKKEIEICKWNVSIFFLCSDLKTTMQGASCFFSFNNKLRFLLLSSCECQCTENMETGGCLTFVGFILTWLWKKTYQVFSEHQIPILLFLKKAACTYFIFSLLIHKDILRCRVVKFEQQKRKTKCVLLCFQRCFEVLIKINRQGPSKPKPGTFKITSI